MKRFILLSLSIVLVLQVFIISSCGKNDKNVTESGTDAETENPLFMPNFNAFPYTVGDQTGHPENSAAEVDIDSILTFKSGFDYSEEYAISFKGESYSDEDKTAKLGLIDSPYGGNTYTYASFNVKSYGAKGDGVADDTAAFVRAIEACKENGGGTVFVPAGYYCLTDSINIPEQVGLIGELKEGTVYGTVLCIYGGKGTTFTSKAAFRMTHRSAIKNMAFWYPEQTFVNGEAIPYPATILQVLTEGVTVENCTFVNSYIGIDFAHGWDNNSLQYVKNIYGTFLSVGYENDKSYDIGKLENFNASADIWLNSQLPGTPNAELLKAYLKKYATGLICERIDWTYYSDITVTGYKVGILSRESSLGKVNGHLYNINLIDCYCCFVGEELNWFIATECTFKASGGTGALAVYIKRDAEGDMTFENCRIISEGDYAVKNAGSFDFTFVNCELQSAKNLIDDKFSSKYTFINCISSDSSINNLTDDTLPALTKKDYNRVVVCKPSSDKCVDLSDAPYSVEQNENITEKLQGAINSLKETGGTVYIPAGYYTVSNHIDVWAGIEVRGASEWEMVYSGVTTLYTSFGLNDPDGEALFTLYDGAGMRGIGVVYNENDKKDFDSYSYTIRGNGSNIYLIDISLPTTYNGVDFATCRCDNHYVEYLYMAVLNNGIKVGAGSENGIIRDCHITPNTWLLRSDADWWNNVYQFLQKQGKPYIIGESKNQILYHNFTYGANEGLTLLDGAEDVYILAHGVDGSNNSACFYGNCTATLVNSQLVTLNSQNMSYIITDSSFTGNVELHNAAFWGDTSTAFYLKGSGTIKMVTGLVFKAGAAMCCLSNGKLYMYGYSCDSTSRIFEVKSYASLLYVTGNRFISSKLISNKNNCEIAGLDK